MEYTLRYPQNVKGLVVSSMQASLKDNADYLNDVIVPQLDEESVKRIRELEAIGDYGSEEYFNLLGPFYGRFIVGMAMEEMPPPLQKFIGTLNEDLYGYMNGPSEFSISGTLSTLDGFGSQEWGISSLRGKSLYDVERPSTFFRRVG